MKLQLHSKDEAVLQLQNDLKTLGFAINDQAEYFGEDTYKAVKKFQRKQHIPSTGIVDETTQEKIKKALKLSKQGEWKVLGQLTSSEGEPLPSVSIILWARNTKKDKKLAKAKTNEFGEFELVYLQPHPCLLVQALGDKNKPIAQAEILQPEAIYSIHLVVGEEFRGKPRFQQLEEQLDRITQAESIKDLDAVRGEDLPFLAKKYEMEENDLLKFFKSKRLAAKADIPHEIGFVLYDFQQGDHFPSFLAQSPSILRTKLSDAIRDGEISIANQSTIEGVIEKFRNRAVEYIFEKPEIKGIHTLDDLLKKTTSLSKGKRKKFFAKYFEYEGRAAQFWEEIEKEPGFNKTKVEEIRKSLQLAAVTWNHVPLVETLWERENIKDVKELVKYEEQDWLMLIDGEDGHGRSVGFPPGLPGENEQEKKKTYARTMTRIVEASFPTAFFFERIDRDEHLRMENRPLLQKFCWHLKAKGQEFALDQVRIERLVDENSDFEVSEEEKMTLIGTFKRTKRLYQLTPNYERYQTLRPLLEDARIQGARSVVERSESAFVSLYAASIGSEQKAKEVYRYARLRSDLTEMIYVEFNPAVWIENPRALPQPSIEMIATFNGLDLPNWESLFGSLDLCHCSHCRSMLSPAAYLVDILTFLRGEDLLQGLLSEDRRSDIARIELNCKNTNTVLPYIDLVNELLESIVSGNSLNNQTTLSEEVLRAIPEHIDREAYDILAQEAIFPWSLPFDLAHEKSKAFLNKIELPRFQIMELFPNLHGLDYGFSGTQVRRKTRNEVIASERLGIAERLRDIITDNLSGEVHPSDFWGWNGDSNTWDESLTDHAALFLKHSGLTYQGALELFEIDYITQGSPLRFEFEPPSSCDLEDASITGLGDDPAEMLHRFQRFVRLSKVLGWHPYDLDRTITTLGAADLNNDLLVDLASIVDLLDRVRRPHQEILSWWGNIDTKDYLPNEGRQSDSLFQQLFFNEAVLSAEESAPFQLNAAGNELDIPLDINSSDDVLLAAFNLSAEDLERLKGQINGDLTLGNLTRIFRLASLGRALRLSIEELLMLLEMIPIDPFASPTNTRHFFAIFDKIKGVRFQPMALAYVLRHGQGPFSSLAIPDTELSVFFSSLQKALATVDEAFPLVPENAADPNLTESDTELTSRLNEQLSMLFPSETILPLTEIVIGNSPLSLTEQQQQLSDLFAVFIQDSSTLFNDLQALDPINGLTERILLVLRPLTNFLRDDQKRNLITRQMADLLGLEVEVTSALLQDVLHQITHSDRIAIDLFLTDTFMQFSSKGPDLDHQHEVYQLWTRIHKAGILLERFRITVGELKWLFDNGPALGVLDWNSLPVAVSPAFLNLFSGWERIHDLLQLRPIVKLPDYSWYRLLDHPNQFQSGGSISTADAQTVFLDELALVSGWERSELAFFAGPGGLNLSFPEDYRNGNAVHQLEECFRALKTTGVSGATVANWANPAYPLATLEQEVKSAVKAKFDNRQWLKLAQEINDPMRELQRNALVDYLLHDRSIYLDEYALYQKYLIDSEMSPCMLTSRIKLAISSVQLYIQRIQLRLEYFLLSPLRLSSDANFAWSTWMKNYRIWEANRKVFLYPENWIEPELRRTKSPFFKELENELGQGALVTGTIKDSVRRYLDKLKKVSHLEVMANYTDSSKVTYIVARTRGVPQQYYFRVWDYPKRWRAWEKMDLDIQGEHMVLTILFGEIYLFWLEFEEKTDGDRLVWEISLAWSVLKQGVWQPKRKSEALSILNFGRPIIIFTSTRQLQNSFVIDLRYKSTQTVSHYFGSFYFHFSGETESFRTPDFISAVPIQEYRPLDTNHLSNFFLQFPNNNERLIFHTQNGNTELLDKTHGIFRITYQSKSIPSGYLEPIKFYDFPFFYLEQKNQ